MSWTPAQSTSWPLTARAEQLAGYVQRENDHVIAVTSSNDIALQETHKMTSAILSDPISMEEGRAQHESFDAPRSSNEFRQQDSSGLPKENLIYNASGILEFIRSLKLKQPNEDYTIGNQLRASILRSPFNILLLATPAGFVVNYTNVSPIAVFFVNFAASIPLSNIIGNAVDDLVKHVGGLLGMLLYMTVGCV
jgi:hypothetical protein